MTQTPAERKAACAARMQRRRALESAVERQRRRQSNATHMRSVRDEETDDASQRRRQSNASHMRTLRSQQTNVHRQAHAQRMQETRRNQSEEQRHANAQRMQRTRASNPCPGSKSIFSMNMMEEMKRIEQTWQTNEDSCQSTNSLNDALLLYYLNSGYARFNEHLSFAKSHDDTEVNCNEINDELEAERLSNAELSDRVEKYFQAHDFNARLCSCGACGLRQFESDYDSASIEYRKVRLVDLPEEHYVYDEEETQRLMNMIEKSPISIPSASNEEDESSTMIDISPWKMVSYYISPAQEEDGEMEQKIYHLHPELVETNISDGQLVEFVWLCPRCHQALQKGMCSSLSIAAGVDFGNYERIEGLMKPNLHEQMILARYRLYATRIKVLPNGRGFQQNHGMNSMRGNQILFQHDAPYKVALADVEELELEAMFEVHFYNEKDQLDQMAKKAYRSTKLYARTNVLLQWFAVLRETNPNYFDLDDTMVNGFVQKVQRVIAKQKKNPYYTCDETSLSFERNLGSDVAAAQQIDAMSSV